MGKIKNHLSLAFIVSVLLIAPTVAWIWVLSLDPTADLRARIFVTGIFVLYILALYRLTKEPS